MPVGNIVSKNAVGPVGNMGLEHYINKMKCVTAVLVVLTVVSPLLSACVD